MPEPSELVLLFLFAVAASSLHAVVGFGSGPLLAPVLLLFVEPVEAVVATIAAGATVNARQLTGEGRRPRIPGRAVWPLWAGAPAGATGSALLSEPLGEQGVTIVLAAVLVACALLMVLAAPQHGRPRTGGPIAGPVLGLFGVLCGASAALTGVFGPLLAGALLAAGLHGDALRDGIGSTFLVVGGCAVTAALVTASPGDAGEGLRLAALMVPAALAGHGVGHRVYGRLGPRHYQRTAIVGVGVGVVLAVAGAAV